MARIAIVDDNFTSARLMSALLRCAGHVTVCIVDGPQAVDLLRLMKPDLLILDLEMPEMDGFAVLERLQRDTGLKSLPVIMCSGRTEQEIRTKALGLGAHDFVVKGTDVLSLLDRIERCLAKPSAKLGLQFSAAVAQ